MVPKPGKNWRDDSLLKQSISKQGGQ